MTIRSAGPALSPEQVALERRALDAMSDVLDLPSDERTVFLRAISDRDAELHEAVQRLLDAHGSLAADSGVFGATAADMIEPVARDLASQDRVSAANAADFARLLQPRYVLEAEIGRGAHAVVFRARDTRHDRSVAVKIMSARRASPDPGERFRREIDIVAKLQHPHIVPLLDSGQMEDSLYLVMPFIAGQTLRHRLDAVGPLPLTEVSAVLGDVAEALDYAHARGVVHRDVKPQNVLLHEGHALLSDFGIALAQSAGGDPRLTELGLAVGTPYYMSPEQASASSLVDHRADVYALACVCFEMLTGEVPYPGSSASSVQAKVMHAPVPDPRVLRASLPDAVSAVLRRGLAKVPADRFPSAGALVEAFRNALDEAVVVPVRAPAPAFTRTWPQRRTIALATVAASVMLAAAIALTRPGQSSDTVAAKADTVTATADNNRDSVIALMPLEYRGAASAEIDDGRRLRRAFLKWGGLSLIDSRRLSEPVGSARRTHLAPDSAAQVARAVGAGRFVLGTLVGDSGPLELSATMYRAGDGATVSESSVDLPADAAATDSAYATLVEKLLFGDLPAPEIAVEPVRSTHYGARREFRLAINALSRWNLPRAEELLASATDKDPQFANASLWLALVRRWGRQPTPRWSSSAVQALGSAASLSPRDAALASAMVALSRDSVRSACRLLEPLPKRAPTDFVGWFALADCTEKDRALVRDPRSPSGWRFRSSPYRAMLLYQRAFELLPAAPLGLRANGFEEARRLLQVSASSLLLGRPLPPGRGLYFASPSLDADTILYVPVTQATLDAADRREYTRAAPRVAEAISRQRALFRDLSISWVASSPRSSAAYTALGLALQLSGESAARDTLARARALASTPLDRLHALIISAMVGIQQSLPDDTARLERARALADSALALGADLNVEHASLASLAMLTGRVDLAVALARKQPRSSNDETPSAIWEASQELLTLAALQVRAPRASALQSTLDALINEGVPPEQREGLKAQAIGRAAMIALPKTGLTSTLAQPGFRHPLLVIDELLARHDTASATRQLRRLTRNRDAVPPNNWTFDVLLPEAKLWEQAGDRSAAVRLLDRALATQAIGTSGLANHVQAGALLRAMAFRAELAKRSGDPAGAKRWATVVVTLLANADGDFAALITRMRSLMS